MGVNVAFVHVPPFLAIFIYYYLFIIIIIIYLLFYFIFFSFLVSYCIAIKVLNILAQ